MSNCKTKIIATALSMLCMTTNVYAVEREVHVYNKDAGIVLAGTLSVPESTPKAICVLATGSGAQDRDETLLGHKPFKVLADTLCRHGYAVLRMDDRGTGASGGVFEGSTLDDFVTDISSGVSYADSAFTAVPICVIGHSEGGSIAIRLAATDRRVNMIVTLAAPAWRGDSVIMSQSRALAMKTVGRWDKESLQRSILDVCVGDMPEMSARMTLQYLLMSQPEASIPQVREQLIKSIDVMVGRYYRRMLRYNPEEDMKSITIPWLALNGDKDIQVLCENLQTIQRLVPTADTRVMSGHNHLFQHCATGLPTEYASLPEAISAETLAVIVEWLDARTNK